MKLDNTHHTKFVKVLILSGEALGLKLTRMPMYISCLTSS